MVREFTDDEMHRAVEWLDSRSLRVNCLICGQNDWVINSRFYEISEVSTDDDAGRYHLIAFICPHCGYIMFLDSKIVIEAGLSAIQNLGQIEKHGENKDQGE